MQFEIFPLSASEVAKWIQIIKYLNIINILNTIWDTFFQLLLISFCHISLNIKLIGKTYLLLVGHPLSEQKYLPISPKPVFTDYRLQTNTNEENKLFVKALILP